MCQQEKKCPEQAKQPEKTPVIPPVADAGEEVCSPEFPEGCRPTGSGED